MLLVFCAGSIYAQDKPVYLHTLEPVGSKYYYRADKMSDNLEMGGLTYTKGVALGAKDGNFVEWNIGGKYKTLSFILGSSPWHNPAHEKGILVITGDGRRIMDRIITTYESPQWFTIDVTGVKVLKFYLPNSDADVGLADAALWTANQKPYCTSARALVKGDKPIMLCRDLMPYRINTGHTICSTNMKFVDPEDRLGYIAKKQQIRISGERFDNGIDANAGMSLIGHPEARSFFNIDGKYSKMTLTVGPQDSDDGTLDRGWFVIKSNDKILYEKEIIEGELATELCLDITDSRYLEFTTQQASGSLRIGIANCMLYPKGYSLPADVASRPKERTIGATSYLKSLPDMCKLITNIPPFAIGGGMSREKALFTDTSQYVTFSMGGVKYSEGVVLQSSTHFFNNNTGAHVLFHLGGEFDNVSFTTGWVGKCGVLKNDWLTVYADDEVVLQVPLRATDPNRHYVVPIKKCKVLKFEKYGMASMDHPAFGLGDMVVYRGEAKPNDLFVHPMPECPEEIDLIDLNKPYIHYVSSAMDVKRLFDGTSQREFFSMPGGERIYKGFLLKTSVHFDLEMGPTSEPSAGIIAPALGASFMMGTVGGATISAVAPFGALIALAAGGTAHESSCAAFNTWGEYNTLTFTVACRLPHNTIDTIDTKQDPIEILKIGTDGEVVAQFEIHDKMKPTTYTVPINGCQQLMFWLECGGSNSGQFILYDLKVSKSSKTTIEIPNIKDRDTRPVVLAPADPYNFDYTRCLPEKVEWDTPSYYGSSSINAYYKLLKQTFRQFDELIDNLQQTKYQTVSRYVKANDGETFRSITIQSALGEKYSFLSLVSRNKQIIESLQSTKTSIASLKVSYGAALASILQVEPKLMKQCRTDLKESLTWIKKYDEQFDIFATEKQAEIDLIGQLIDSAYDLDGIGSSEQEVFVK